MADVFPLQIISPSAVVIDTDVAMVEVPGVEGDFGVLAKHAPFFSMIRPGVIRVTLADGQSMSYFAAAGYADVSPTGTTILSDRLQDLREITTPEAVEAVNAAKAALAEATTDDEKRAAEKLLSAAEALALAVAA